jgi:N-terminal 7TM region of histidine kinase
VSIAVKAPRRDGGQPRLAPWAAVVVWLVVGLLTVCTFTLRVVTQTGAFGEPWYLAALGDLAFFMLPTVGLVIAVRRPKLVFGWLMLVAGLAFAGGELAHGYATQALLHPGTLPGGMVAAFLQTLQLIGFVLLPLLLLLFPDGRLPTPRWTPLAWAAVACPVLMLPALLLTPGLMLDGVPASRNPFGLQALEGTDLGGPLFAAWYLILLLALVSLLLRFRRARGEQRQQRKWVMLGGALFPISFFIEDLGNPTLNAVVDLLAITAFCGAIGVAILKYRLYDIDRIINRTLVYGLLSVLLGLGYAAVVLGLGRLLPQGSSLAVAGATLAVAALFQPARRRIQRVVDQRFNRRKYNATKTVEAFSARLRDQVDLDTLSADLLAVADQTMQPTTVSLWLRPPDEVSKPHALHWDY